MESGGCPDGVGGSLGDVETGLLQHLGPLQRRPPGEYNHLEATAQAACQWCAAGRPGAEGRRRVVGSKTYGGGRVFCTYGVELKVYSQKQKGFRFALFFYEPEGFRAAFSIPDKHTTPPSNGPLRPFGLRQRSLRDASRRGVKPAGRRRL